MHLTYNKSASELCTSAQWECKYFHRCFIEFPLLFQSSEGVIAHSIFFQSDEVTKLKAAYGTFHLAERSGWSPTYSLQVETMSSHFNTHITELCITGKISIERGIFFLHAICEFATKLFSLSLASTTTEVFTCLSKSNHHWFFFPVIPNNTWPHTFQDEAECMRWGSPNTWKMPEEEAYTDKLPFHEKF